MKYEIPVAVRVEAPDLEAAEQVADDICAQVIEWEYVTLVEAGRPEWRSI